VILFDTSAIYALADRADTNHAEAKRILRRLQGDGEELILHTYILAEAFSLLHRRHGLAVAVRMSEDTSALRTVTVDRAVHGAAVRWLRRAKGRAPSLVDAVSFEVMNSEGIRTAFAFDPDFERAGFSLAG
jgi:predicted nucleic acid-binding protein